MIEKISATEGALRRGAEAVIGAHGDITASLGRVRTQLEELSAAWEGDAATSYAHMLTTWREDAGRLNRILVHLEDALRGTERDQAATEDEHRATIGGLGSMMGAS
ncbi:WXG100 family type VII secretion target [Microbacterium sp. P03]|uniref:WXG100 family type VII secretion target n=1 Tax=Microbacterium sp. P03 TaxID=3366946 RepID=UPI0037473541